MKIGMIGMGHIAQKAYLPILAQTKGIELHICTRNKDTLKEIGNTYHLDNLYTDIDQWINSGITAAFIHSATLSHEAIIDKLLDHGIHVYVDKPVTNHSESTKRLMKKADEKNLVLMVGFNRRYAPSYNSLKELSDPNMIIMQKNVAKPAGEIRHFIFDDFIHVIDTILYLFPYEIESVQVNSKVTDGILNHVVLQLNAQEGTAIGVMNRNVGASLERVEFMNATETRVVTNVNEVKAHRKEGILTQLEDTWQPTLEKRGFQDIITYFLDEVNDHSVPYKQNRKEIETHELAEYVVNSITTS